MPASVTMPWHRRSDSPYKASVPGLYFHESDAAVKLFGGAVGGTKTTTLATEIIYLSAKYKNNRGFAGERDFDDLRRGLYNEIMEWLPENGRLADGRELYQHHKSEHWIRFYNGSEIHFIELKEEPRNVNLGWAAIDQAERVPEKSYEWMQTRLRLEDIPYRPLMLSANPEPGWVKRVIVDKVMPSQEVVLPATRTSGDQLKVFGNKDLLFIPSFPEDNEHLPSDYIPNLYRTLSPTLVERLLKGVWDVVENAIYPQLMRDLMLVPLPLSGERGTWVQGAGGADYGKEHLSAIVSVTKNVRGEYWVRECWAESGGDAQRIEDNARGAKIRYNLTSGCTDPIQDVLAQHLGWRVAKTGAGSRKGRIAEVTKLLNAGVLFFDINGPGVRELFEEMQVYHYEHVETEIKSEDVVVRKGEDRVAALEYAIEAFTRSWDYQPPVTRTINWVQKQVSKPLGAMWPAASQKPRVQSIGRRLGE